MRISNNIKQLMAETNVALADLAGLTEVSEKTLRNYINGKTFPNERFFKNLEDCYPELNFHWLITGQGEMFSLDSSQRLVEENLKHYSISPEKEMEHAFKIAIKQHERRITLIEELLEDKREVISLLKDKVKYLKEELKKVKA